MRHKLLIYKKRVSVSLSLSLKGEGNQIAEPTLGHGILRGKQPVIRGERQFMAASHRFGQQTASHPPCVRRRDRFREEKPDMCTVSRPGSFHCGSEAIFITALAECADICLPACLVEIRRQQICCVILQHGINSDHITAQRVAPQ